MLGGLLSPDMVNATVKFVAVCTRVAWFSHKSAGYNAHTLLEDLFDSESEDGSDFEELTVGVQAK